MAAIAVAIPMTATAKTVTVGQHFKPQDGCNPGTILQTGVSAGNSYVVPKAGVITSWSFHDTAMPVTGLKLKVGRSAGTGRYEIVGQATAGKQTPNFINTYKTHIPVHAGDLLGLYEDGGGDCATVISSSLDTYLYDVATDVAPGTTTSDLLPMSGVRYPVSAHVSLDCVVPNLKGKTLTAAKDALKAHSCTLGTVSPKGQTTGKVTAQSPAAGKTLAPEAKVNIRLG
jgi:hypothetical protein